MPKRWKIIIGIAVGVILLLWALKAIFFSDNKRIANNG